MNITILGIKRIPEKNGAHIYYTYHENNVTGVATEHKWLSNFCFPIDNIVIGKEYVVEINDYKFSTIREVVLNNRIINDGGIVK